MDEIKKLLSNQNFPKQIKCNVIFMLTDSNKSQAKNIISLVDEFKATDPEFSNYMLQQMNEVEEYKEIIRELNISVEEAGKVESVQCNKINDDAANKSTSSSNFTMHGTMHNNTHGVAHDYTYASTPTHAINISTPIDYTPYTTKSSAHTFNTNVMQLISGNSSFNATENVVSFFNDMKKSPIIPFYIKSSGYNYSQFNSQNRNNNKNDTRHNNNRKQSQNNGSSNSKLPIPIELKFYKKDTKNPMRQCRNRNNSYESNNENAISEFHAKRYKNTREDENKGYNNSYTATQAHIQVSNPYNSPQAHIQVSNPYNSPQAHIQASNPYNSPLAHAQASNPYNSPLAHAQASNPYNNPYAQANNTHNTGVQYNSAQFTTPQAHQQYNTQQPIYAQGQYTNNPMQGNTPSIYAQGQNNNNNIMQENHYNSNALMHDFYAIFTYKLQCTICGLRFFEDENGKSNLIKHLEEHSRKARNVDKREYFIRYEDFNNNYVKIDLEMPEKEVENKILIAENVICDICKNKIEKGWNDEVDNWILLDCVVIDEQRKKYCHRSCIM